MMKRLAQDKLAEDILQYLEDGVLNRGELLEFVERSMYEAVMTYTRGNQAQATKVTGVARGTLRAKLMQYFGTTLVGKITYKNFNSNWRKP